MIGRKFIVVIAAIAALVGGVLLGLYVLGQGPFGPASTDGGPVADSSPAATPSEPSAGTQPAGPDTAPAPQASVDASASLKSPSEPTSVPTFDVVVIEPNGEGVIAGRAAPGWKVSVQSGGAKVGEAKVDAQGEWSVVLDTPLPKGEHALSLKITSPDGTRALSSQESVRVAVGANAGKAGVPAGIDGTATASVPAPQTPAPAAETPVPAPQAVAPTPTPSPSAQPAPLPSSEAKVANTDQAPASPEGPRATARSEQAAPAPRPTLVFKTVDYVDDGAGTVTLSGVADPGAKISIFSDNAPLGDVQVERDGSWRMVIQKKLGMGQHSFRAEQASGAGAPTQTAMVTVERVEPKPEPAPPVAAKPTAVAAAEKKESPGTYIIRQGDTLWAIAKRYLGSGLRYTSIFQDNRQVIRNPNLIHPKQELNVPAN